MRGNPFCDNFIFSGAPIKPFLKKKIKIKWVWFKINAKGALSDFWGLEKKRKLLLSLWFLSAFLISTHSHLQFCILKLFIE